MNLLLDTCALLALAGGRLPPPAAAALQSARQVMISPIVLWELAIKVKSGKLILDEPPLNYVQMLAARHQLNLPAGGLDAELLCAAADLPLIHRDPFDRVLIATARRHQLTLVTSDQIIPTYPNVNTLWLRHKSNPNTQANNTAKSLSIRPRRQIRLHGASAR